MKTPLNFSFILICAMLIPLTLSSCTIGSTDPEAESPTETIAAAKPVIYLYPEEITAVSVRLDYDGDLAVTYPDYGGGWQVTAHPDGSLINHADEGESAAGNYDFSSGFCVAGADVKDFLQEALPALGLTPREYNEFIVYWLPKMQNNPYNLISFQQEEYTDHARLTVEPQPDSILRVFMAWQALEEPVDIPAQELEPFTRTGFTVVEWGGAQAGGQ